MPHGTTSPLVYIVPCHLSWSHLHSNVNHTACDFVANMALLYMLQHSNSKAFEILIWSTLFKVDNPYSVTSLIWTPILYLSGTWFCAAPRMETNIHVFKRGWSVCSTYDNHSKVNTIGWGGHTHMQYPSYLLLSSAPSIDAFFSPKTWNVMYTPCKGWSYFIPKCHYPSWHGYGC